MQDDGRRVDDRGLVRGLEAATGRDQQAQDLAPRLAATAEPAPQGLPVDQLPAVRLPSSTTRTNTSASKSLLMPNLINRAYCRRSCPVKPATAGCGCRTNPALAPTLGLPHPARPRSAHSSFRRRGLHALLPDRSRGYATRGSPDKEISSMPVRTEYLSSEAINLSRRCEIACWGPRGTPWRLDRAHHGKKARQ